MAGRKKSRKRSAPVRRRSVKPDSTEVLSPVALTLKQAARILSAAGAEYATVKNFREDIKAGAPTNADGSINLIDYAAWLVREVATRGH